MLKQKIKLLPTKVDSSISIRFQSEYMLGGLSEDIENLVTAQTTESINDTTDAENLRFMPSITYSLSNMFYKTISSSYVSNVAPNEFASSATTTTAFLSSFYIYKIFDSTIENKQNLLFTGYLNGFNFIGYSSSGYVWNNSFEYADIHIPNSYISSLTGNTFNLYMKMHFYSAKSSHIYPFATGTTTNSEASLYNKLTFNLSTKKYTVTTPFTFYEITNPSYVNLINDSVDSVSIDKPVYPSGNTFTIDGSYITVS